MLQHRLVRLLYRNVVRFEVPTFLVRIEVFGDNALCRLIHIYQSFEESCCFGLWGEAVQKCNVIRNALTSFGALLLIERRVHVVIIFQ
jgi:hypothetical protein